MIHIVNFAHPLTDEQIEKIKELASKADAIQVINVKVQLDHEADFQEQIRSFVNAVGLNSTQWQNECIVVNLPSLAVVAAGILAELHGRMGYFPPVIRMRPIAGTIPLKFEVAEIVLLQSIRENSRKCR